MPVDTYEIIFLLQKYIIIYRENPVERIGYQKDGIKDIQKHQ